MSPNIGKVLVRGAAFGFSAGAVLALLPLVARDVVKGDALTYGIMIVILPLMPALDWTYLAASGFQAVY